MNGVPKGGEHAPRPVEEKPITQIKLHIHYLRGTVVKLEYVEL